MPKQPNPTLNPSNFPMFIAMAVLIGIAGGLGTELVKALIPSAVWAPFLASLLLIVGLGLVLSPSVRMVFRQLGRTQTVLESRRVVRARVLLVLVSKSKGRLSALEAALYHAEEGVLEQLWLLTSRDAQEDAEFIRQEIERTHPRVQVHPPIILNDIHSITLVKQEVEAVRRTILRGKIHDNDVICDFTGLTKQASAGMILASAPKEARLQYMHPRRFLEDGRADPEAGSDPVEVQIAYHVDEDDGEE